MVIDQGGWFSEVLGELGCAFSLRITAKLHEEQSPYQHIEIYATQAFGNLMVIDGSIMLTAGTTSSTTRCCPTRPCSATRPRGGSASSAAATAGPCARSSSTRRWSRSPRSTSTSG